MEQLHVQWMDEPGPTDVLSFPMDELRPGRDGRAQPARPARRRRALPAGGRSARRGPPGTPPQEELLLLTTHGILHLLGYDHAEPEEEKEMFALQRRLLLTFLATRGKRLVNVPVTRAADGWPSASSGAGRAVRRLRGRAVPGRPGPGPPTCWPRAGRGRTALARVAADPAPTLSVSTFLRVAGRGGRRRFASPLVFEDWLGAWWQAGLAAAVHAWPRCPSCSSGSARAPWAASTPTGSAWSRPR